MISSLLFLFLCGFFGVTLFLWYVLILGVDSSVFEMMHKTCIWCSLISEWDLYFITKIMMDHGLTYKTHIVLILNLNMTCTQRWESGMQKERADYYSQLFHLHCLSFVLVSRRRYIWYFFVLFLETGILQKQVLNWFLFSFCLQSVLTKAFSWK